MSKQQASIIRVAEPPCRRERCEGIGLAALCGRSFDDCEIIGSLMLTVEQCAHCCARCRLFVLCCCALLFAESRAAVHYLPSVEIDY